MLANILLQEKNAGEHFDIYESSHIKPVMGNLGQRVRSRRETLGLTQGQLAQRSGVDQSQISRLERGDIDDPYYIYELSRALETSVRWLKTGIEDNLMGQEVARAVGETPRITPYQQTVNSMTAAEEAAELWKAFVTTSPDTQKIFADWIRKITPDFPGSEKNASRGETTKPKKNN